MSDLNPADVERVARLFQSWGAAEDRADVMARQLLKRARQMAAEQSISEVEAAENLLSKVIEARQGG